mmetsp:Transcript_15449/g.32553  ORF Transcript_15449/g.32553 Transcript_15449/m.32553 type:complete len:757 (-) Transcript_15449:72-2342(-)
MVSTPSTAFIAQCSPEPELAHIASALLSPSPAKNERLFVDSQEKMARLISEVSYLEQQAQMCPVPAGWTRYFDEHGKEVYIHDYGRFPPQHRHPLLGYFAGFASVVLAARSGRLSREQFRQELKQAGARIDKEAEAVAAAWSGPFLLNNGLEWRNGSWSTTKNPAAPTQHLLQVLHGLETSGACGWPSAERSMPESLKKLNFEEFAPALPLPVGAKVEALCGDKWRRCRVVALLESTQEVRVLWSHMKTTSDVKRKNVRLRQDVEKWKASPQKHSPLVSPSLAPTKFVPVIPEVKDEAWLQASAARVHCLARANRAQALESMREACMRGQGSDAAETPETAATPSRARVPAASTPSRPSPEATLGTPWQTSLQNATPEVEASRSNSEAKIQGKIPSLATPSTATPGIRTLGSDDADPPSIDCSGGTPLMEPNGGATECSWFDVASSQGSPRPDTPRFHSDPPSRARSFSPRCDLELTYAALSRWKSPSPFHRRSAALSWWDRAEIQFNIATPATSPPPTRERDILASASPTAFTTDDLEAVYSCNWASPRSSTRPSAVPEPPALPGRGRRRGGAFSMAVLAQTGPIARVESPEPKEAAGPTPRWRLPAPGSSTGRREGGSCLSPRRSATSAFYGEVRPQRLDFTMTPSPQQLWSPAESSVTDCGTATSSQPRRLEASLAEASEPSGYPLAGGDGLADEDASGRRRLALSRARLAQSSPPSRAQGSERTRERGKSVPSKADAVACPPRRLLGAGFLL